MRKPKGIKKLTAAGESVRITDHGKPLWIIIPDPAPHPLDDDEARKRSWEEAYADLLSEPVVDLGLPSIAQIVIDARGDR